MIQPEGADILATALKNAGAHSIVNLFATQAPMVHDIVFVDTETKNDLGSESTTASTQIKVTEVPFFTFAPATHRYGTVLPSEDVVFDFVTTVIFGRVSVELAGTDWDFSAATAADITFSVAGVTYDASKGNWTITATSIAVAIFPSGKERSGRVVLTVPKSKVAINQAPKGQLFLVTAKTQKFAESGQLVTAEFGSTTASVVKEAIDVMITPGATAHSLARNQFFFANSSNNILEIQGTISEDIPTDGYVKVEFGDEWDLSTLVSNPDKKIRMGSKTPFNVSSVRVSNQAGNKNVRVFAGSPYAGKNIVVQILGHHLAAPSTAGTVTLGLVAFDARWALLNKGTGTMRIGGATLHASVAPSAVAVSSAATLLLKFVAESAIPAGGTVRVFFSDDWNLAGVDLSSTSLKKGSTVQVSNSLGSKSVILTLLKSVEPNELYEATLSTVTAPATSGRFIMTIKTMDSKQQLLDAGTVDVYASTSTTPMLAASASTPFVVRGEPIPALKIQFQAAADVPTAASTIVEFVFTDQWPLTDFQWDLAPLGAKPAENNLVTCQGVTVADVHVFRTPTLAPRQIMGATYFGNRVHIVLQSNEAVASIDASCTFANLRAPRIEVGTYTIRVNILDQGATGGGVDSHSSGRGKVVQAGAVPLQVVDMTETPDFSVAVVPPVLIKGQPMPTAYWRVEFLLTTDHAKNSRVVLAFAQAGGFELAALRPTDVTLLGLPAGTNVFATAVDSTNALISMQVDAQLPAGRYTLQVPSASLSTPNTVGFQSITIKVTTETYPFAIKEICSGGVQVGASTSVQLDVVSPTFVAVSPGTKAVVNRTLFGVTVKLPSMAAVTDPSTLLFQLRFLHVWDNLEFVNLADPARLAVAGPAPFEAAHIRSRAARRDGTSQVLDIEIEQAGIVAGGAYEFAVEARTVAPPANPKAQEFRAGNFRIDLVVLNGQSNMEIAVGSTEWVVGHSMLWNTTVAPSRIRTGDIPSDGSSWKFAFNLASAPLKKGDFVTLSFSDEWQFNALSLAAGDVQGQGIFDAFSHESGSGATGRYKQITVRANQELAAYRKCHITVKGGRLVSPSSPSAKYTVAVTTSSNLGPTRAHGEASVAVYNKMSVFTVTPNLVAAQTRPGANWTMQFELRKNLVAGATIEFKLSNAWPVPPLSSISLPTVTAHNYILSTSGLDTILLTVGNQSGWRDFNAIIPSGMHTMSIERMKFMPPSTAGVYEVGITVTEACPRIPFKDRVDAACTATHATACEAVVALGDSTACLATAGGGNNCTYTNAGTLAAIGHDLTGSAGGSMIQAVVAQVTDATIAANMIMGGTGTGLTLTYRSGTTAITKLAVATVGKGYTVGDVLTVAKADCPGGPCTMDLTITLKAGDLNGLAVAMCAATDATKCTSYQIGALADVGHDLMGSTSPLTQTVVQQDAPGALKTLGHDLMESTAPLSQSVAHQQTDATIAADKISGGTGSGLSLTYQASSASVKVTKLTVATVGEGYIVGDVLTIAKADCPGGPCASDLVITLKEADLNGILTEATIAADEITGGTGTGLSLIYRANGGTTAITKLDVATAGSGYTVGDVLTVAKADCPGGPCTTDLTITLKATDLMDLRAVVSCTKLGPCTHAAELAAVPSHCQRNGAVLEGSSAEVTVRAKPETPNATNAMNVAITPNSAPRSLRPFVDWRFDFSSRAKLMQGARIEIQFSDDWDLRALLEHVGTARTWGGGPVSWSWDIDTEVTVENVVGRKVLKVTISEQDALKYVAPGRLNITINLAALSAPATVDDKDVNGDVTVSVRTYDRLGNLLEADAVKLWTFAPLQNAKLVAHGPPSSDGMDATNTLAPGEKPSTKWKIMFDSDVTLPSAGRVLLDFPRGVFDLGELKTALGVQTTLSGFATTFSSTIAISDHNVVMTLPSGLAKGSHSIDIDSTLLAAPTIPGMRTLPVTLYGTGAPVDLTARGGGHHVSGDGIAAVAGGSAFLVVYGQMTPDFPVSVVAAKQKLPINWRLHIPAQYAPAGSFVQLHAPAAWNFGSITKDSLAASQRSEFYSTTGGPYASAHHDAFGPNHVLARVTRSPQAPENIAPVVIDIAGTDLPAPVNGTYRVGAHVYDFFGHELFRGFATVTAFHMLMSSTVTPYETPVSARPVDRDDWHLQPGQGGESTSSSNWTFDFHTTSPVPAGGGLELRFSKFWDLSQVRTSSIVSATIDFAAISTTRGDVASAAGSFAFVADELVEATIITVPINTMLSAGQHRLDIVGSHLRAPSTNGAHYVHITTMHTQGGLLDSGITSVSTFVPMVMAAVTPSKSTVASRPVGNWIFACKPSAPIPVGGALVVRLVGQWRRQNMSSSSVTADFNGAAFVVSTRDGDRNGHDNTTVILEFNFTSAVAVTVNAFSIVVDGASLWSPALTGDQSVEFSTYSDESTLTGRATTKHAAAAQAGLVVAPDRVAYKTAPATDWTIAATNVNTLEAGSTIVMTFGTTWELSRHFFETWEKTTTRKATDGAKMSTSYEVSGGTTINLDTKTTSTLIAAIRPRPWSTGGLVGTPEPRTIADVYYANPDKALVSDGLWKVTNGSASFRTIGAVALLLSSSSAAPSTMVLFVDGDNSTLGGSVLRTFDPATGEVRTVAGGGASKLANAPIQDGVGSAAKFGFITSLVLSRSRKFALVVDATQQTIRRVVLGNGAVTTVTGDFNTTNSTPPSDEVKPPWGDYGLNATLTTRRPFKRLHAVAMGADDSYALALDGDLVRRINLENGSVWTVAGNENGGSSDGVGVAASFANPGGIAVSADGTLVAVSGNHSLRLISQPSMGVTTVSLPPTFGADEIRGVEVSYNASHVVVLFESGVAHYHVCANQWTSIRTFDAGHLQHLSLHSDSSGMSAVVSHSMPRVLGGATPYVFRQGLIQLDYPLPTASNKCNPEVMVDNEGVDWSVVVNEGTTLAAGTFTAVIKKASLPAPAMHAAFGQYSIEIATYAPDGKLLQLGVAGVLSGETVSLLTPLSVLSGMLIPTPEWELSVKTQFDVPTNGKIRLEFGNDWDLSKFFANKNSQPIVFQGSKIGALTSVGHDLKGSTSPLTQTVVQQDAPGGLKIIGHDLTGSTVPLTQTVVQQDAPGGFKFIGHDLIGSTVPLTQTVVQQDTDATFTVISGGTGTGLTITYQANGGTTAITKLTVATAGSGYTVGDVLTVHAIDSPGISSDLTITLKETDLITTDATISADKITGGTGTGLSLTYEANGGTTAITKLAVATVGKGYTVGDVLTVAKADCPGGPCTTDLTITLKAGDLNGILTEVTIAAGEITGGTGTGLSLNYQADGGTTAITKLTVATVGSGYKVGDVLTVAKADCPGGPCASDLTITLKAADLKYHVLETNLTAVHNTRGSKALELTVNALAGVEKAPDSIEIRIPKQTLMGPGGSGSLSLGQTSQSIFVKAFDDTGAIKHASRFDVWVLHPLASLSLAVSSGTKDAAASTAASSFPDIDWMFTFVTHTSIEEDGSVLIEFAATVDLTAVIQSAVSASFTVDSVAVEGGSKAPCAPRCRPTSIRVTTSDTGGVAPGDHWVSIDKAVLKAPTSGQYNIYVTTHPKVREALTQATQNMYRLGGATKAIDGQWALLSIFNVFEVSQPYIAAAAGQVLEAPWEFKFDLASSMIAAKGAYMRLHFPDEWDLSTTSFNGVSATNTCTGTNPACSNGNLALVGISRSQGSKSITFSLDMVVNMAAQVNVSILGSALQAPSPPVAQHEVGLRLYDAGGAILEAGGASVRTYRNLSKVSMFPREVAEGARPSVEQYAWNALTTTTGDWSIDFHAADSLSQGDRVQMLFFGNWTLERVTDGVKSNRAVKLVTVDRTLSYEHLGTYTFTKKVRSGHVWRVTFLLDEEVPTGGVVTVGIKGDQLVAPWGSALNRIQISVFGGAQADTAAAATDLTGLAHRGWVYVRSYGYIGNAKIEPRSVLRGMTLPVSTPWTVHFTVMHTVPQNGFVIVRLPHAWDASAVKTASMIVDNGGGGPWSVNPTVSKGGWSPSGDDGTNDIYLRLPMSVPVGKVVVTLAGPELRPPAAEDGDYPVWIYSQEPSGAMIDRGYAEIRVTREIAPVRAFPANMTAAGSAYWDGSPMAFGENLTVYFVTHPFKGADVELQGSNDNAATNLQACIGECDTDEQCAIGLKCFQRSGYETIPGCKGQGKFDWDYCYNPDCTLTYCNAHVDLKNAFCGGNTCSTQSQSVACYGHWTEHGRGEGRIPDPDLCLNFGLNPIKSVGFNLTGACRINATVDGWEEMGPILSPLPNATNVTLIDAYKNKVDATCTATHATACRAVAALGDSTACLAAAGGGNNCAYAGAGAFKAIGHDLAGSVAPQRVAQQETDVTIPVGKITGGTGTGLTLVYHAAAIDQANCLSSAVKQFGSKVAETRPLLQTGSWGHVPPGCSVESAASTAHGAQSTGDWAAHWNTLASGTNNGAFTQVTTAITKLAVATTGKGYTAGDVLTIVRADCPGGPCTNDILITLKATDLNGLTAATCSAADAMQCLAFAVGALTAVDHNLAGSTAPLTQTVVQQDDDATIAANKVTGGSGTGLSLTYQASGGTTAITKLTVATVGSGYKVGDVLTVAEADCPGGPCTTDITITLKSTDLMDLSVATTCTNLGACTYAAEIPPLTTFPVALEHGWRDPVVSVAIDHSSIVFTSASTMPPGHYAMRIPPPHVLIPTAACGSNAVGACSVKTGTACTDDALCTWNPLQAQVYGSCIASDAVMCATVAALGDSTACLADSKPCTYTDAGTLKAIGHDLTGSALPLTQTVVQQDTGATIAADKITGGTGTGLSLTYEANGGTTAITKLAVATVGKGYTVGDVLMVAKADCPGGPCTTDLTITLKAGDLNGLAVAVCAATDVAKCAAYAIGALADVGHDLAGSAAHLTQTVVQQDADATIAANKITGAAAVPGTKYTPSDFGDQGRTVDTADGCRIRCAAVARCAYWTRWDGGGCHLSLSSAIRVTHAEGGVTSGGGTGTGLSLTYQANGGTTAITKLAVATIGSGYKVGDVLTVAKADCPGGPCTTDITITLKATDLMDLSVATTCTDLGKCTPSTDFLLPAIPATCSATNDALCKLAGVQGSAGCRGTKADCEWTVPGAGPCIVEIQTKEANGFMLQRGESTLQVV